MSDIIETAEVANQEEVVVEEEVDAASVNTNNTSGLVEIDESRYNINLFNEVYDKIRSMIQNKQFSASNWITLVVMSMEMVETLPKLHGHEKRDLVVDLLTKLVSEIPMSEGDRLMVAGLVRTALPGIIDAIVDGSLGKLNINVIAEHAAAAADDIAQCWRGCVGKCNRKSKTAKSSRRRK